MRRIAILGLLATLCVATAAVPANADERRCAGSIGAETVDNLKVPDGATCRLQGTVVEGNIVVETGATLDAEGVRVDGNVQAENHRQVTVADSRVGGSIQVKQGGGSTVLDTRVDGDLQWDANADRLDSRGNLVGGNLQAFSNRGGIDVSGNTIDGNLQCKSNNPAPTGGGNVVRGSAEDQCAGLTGGAPTPPAPPPADGRFCDTRGHTHEHSIDKVAAAGIARGDRHGCYRPDAPVTRGQAATFLARAYHLPEGPSRFCDTRGHTHEAGIDAVAAAGIARGDRHGCYRPDTPVTRGQTATFLTRAARLAPAGTAAFCDTRGHTHEASIDAVAAAGIARGDGGGCYRPDAPVTRGQTATFLARALGL